jgi:hypothetical protein
MSSTSRRPKPSNARDFLNKISKYQAKALKADIIALDKYKLLINPRNIINSEITVDEIGSLTSTVTYNGESYL